MSDNIRNEWSIVNKAQANITLSSYGTARYVELGSPSSCILLRPFRFASGPFCGVPQKKIEMALRQDVHCLLRNFRDRNTKDGISNSENIESTVNSIVSRTLQNTNLATRKTFTGTDVDMLISSLFKDPLVLKLLSHKICDLGKKTKEFIRLIERAAANYDMSPSFLLKHIFDTFNEEDQEYESGRSRNADRFISVRVSFNKKQNWSALSFAESIYDSFFQNKKNQKQYSFSRHMLSRILRHEKIVENMARDVVKRTRGVSLEKLGGDSDNLISALNSGSGRSAKSDHQMGVRKTASGRSAGSRGSQGGGGAEIGKENPARVYALSLRFKPSNEDGDPLPKLSPRGIQIEEAFFDDPADRVRRPADRGGVKKWEALVKKADRLRSLKEGADNNSADVLRRTREVEELEKNLKRSLYPEVPPRSSTASMFRQPESSLDERQQEDLDVAKEKDGDDDFNQPARI